MTAEAITKTAKQNVISILPYVLLAAALVPWFMVQINMSINPDLAYLTQSAIYMLDGMRMSEAYYDNNPPLSVIVQIPPALLVKYLSVPIYYAVFLYGLLAVTLSAAALRLILRQTGWFAPHTQTTILATYILVNTIGTNLYLGEKDHLLALALFPFVFVQAAITYKVNLNKPLKWAVITAASILILLKPHYGLIPLALFAHRMIVQKRITVFLDQDFIALAAAALAYITLVFVAFNDYISIILPDVILLYTTAPEIWVLKIAALFTAATLMAALLALILFDKPRKKTAALFLLAALCIIPFAMQGKGFFYHAIPAALFACLAFTMLIEEMLFIAIQKRRTRKISRKSASLCTLMIFFTLIYTTLPPNTHYPTHQDYRKTQFAQIINSCDRPDCTFFMFNDMIEITQQLAVYTGQPHASRFSGYWFLPSLLQRENKNTDEQNALQLSFKYADLTAQDLKKYKPDTLIIGHFNILEEESEPFDFMAFNSEHSPTFAKIIQNYDLTDTITVDRSEYFKGTFFPPDAIQYDIYKKKKTQP